MDPVVCVCSVTLGWKGGSQGVGATAAAFIGLVKIDFLLDPIEGGGSGVRKRAGGWRAGGNPLIVSTFSFVSIT